MDKSAEFTRAVDELRLATNKTVEAAKALVALCMDKDDTEQIALPNEPQPKPPKLEEIRAVLADKSRGGHTDAIKEIINRHGAGKLSDVDPSQYASILAEVEALE